MTPIAVSVEVGAEMIDTSPTTLRSYIDQRLIAVVKLPSAKHQGELSRRVLVSVDDLREFVAKHRMMEPAR